MYKRILLSAAALLAAGTATAWKIEGHIAGVQDKDTVAVYCHLFYGNYGNYGKRIGIDTLRNGRFSFAADTLPEGLNMMSVGAAEGDKSFTLWVREQTRIQITGDRLGDSWAVVSDEPEQTIQAEIDAVDLSDLKVLTRTKASYWKYRDSVWRVSVERLWPVYAKYPNSLAMLDNLNFYLGVGAVPEEKLQWLYAQLTPDSKESRYGKAVAVALEATGRVPQVGDRYADIPVTDLSGTARRLSDYAGRGKYVLLDFWSGGCKGCLAAFPKLKELHKAYGEQLVIVGINYDTDKGIWKKAAEKWELPWAQISDGMGFSGPMNASYRVTVEPTYILIAPDGKVAGRWDGRTQEMLGGVTLLLDGRQ